MSDLLERIRFLAEHPEVGVQHFNAREAKEFLAEYEPEDAVPLLTLTTLRNLGSSCPSQWEGETSLGERVYIRYRHGWLAVRVCLGDSGFDTEPSTEIYSEQVGDALDGVMSTTQMLKHTGIEVSDG